MQLRLIRNRRGGCVFCLRLSVPEAINSKDKQDKHAKRLSIQINNPRDLHRERLAMPGLVQPDPSRFIQDAVCGVVFPSSLSLIEHCSHSQ